MHIFSHCLSHTRREDPLNESERSAYEALFLFLIRARLEDDFSRGTIFIGEARVE
jgi:hypothetical protein